jgi:hypothetical protein
MDALLTDPEDEKTGMRLRTLAERLGIEEKDFATIKATAGADLKALILSTASVSVPDGKAAEKRHYQSQGKTWFKSVDGGRELAAKLFSLGLWPALKPQLLPFCNAVRKAVDLDELLDLTP